MSISVIMQVLGWIPVAWLLTVHLLVERNRLPREGMAFRIAGCAAAAVVIVAAVASNMWPVAALGLLWLRTEVFAHRHAMLRDSAHSVAHLLHVHRTPGKPTGEHGGSELSLDPDDPELLSTHRDPLADMTRNPGSDPSRPAPDGSGDLGSTREGSEHHDSEDEEHEHGLEHPDPDHDVGHDPAPWWHPERKPASPATNGSGGRSGGRTPTATAATARVATKSAARAVHPAKGSHPSPNHKPASKRLGPRAVDAVFKIEVVIMIIVALVVVSAWAQHERPIFNRKADASLCRFEGTC